MTKLFIARSSIYGLWDYFKLFMSMRGKEYSKFEMHIYGVENETKSSS